MPKFRIPRATPTFIVWSIALACFALALFGFAGCASQGYSSTSALVIGLGAGTVAFVAAPLDALTAIGLAILFTLGFMSFAPKYDFKVDAKGDPQAQQSSEQGGPSQNVPLPAGWHLPSEKTDEQPPEKPFLKKTWWEVLFG
jgi:hypothetical protein